MRALRETIQPQVGEDPPVDGTTTAHARVEPCAAGQLLQLRGLGRPRPRAAHDQDVRVVGELLQQSDLLGAVVVDGGREDVRAERPERVDDDVEREHREHNRQRRTQDADDEARELAGGRPLLVEGRGAAPAARGLEVGGARGDHLLGGARCRCHNGRQYQVQERVCARLRRRCPAGTAAGLGRSRRSRATPSARGRQLSGEVLERRPRLGLLDAGEVDPSRAQGARTSAATWNASPGVHFVESSRMRVLSG